MMNIYILYVLYVLAANCDRKHVENWTGKLPSFFSSKSGNPDRLTGYLLEPCVYYSFSDETYAVHVECINVLLTLLSIQLSHTHPIPDSRIYQHIVNGNWYGGWNNTQSLLVYLNPVEEFE